MLISFFIGGKNMTIKECIDIVDNLKPNQYSIKEKVMWLSFIDEVIINDVLKTHEGYDGIYDDFTGYSEDKLSVRLIVTSPYDRLYPAYLKMKIDSENGETARYNNSVALFNSYMMEFRKYYNKTHMPLDITKPRTNSKGDYEGGSSNTTVVPAKDAVYNIVDEYMNNNIDKFMGKNGASAYVVAVNNGFEGTEEEWLEQLSGVYVGSGEMPVGYSVQIDPDGDTVDMDNYATKDYVDEEIATFDFIKVVETLPEIGLPNKIYLVPRTESDENNLFDEYIWANDAWEFITTKVVEVDLTNYPTKEEMQQAINPLSVDYIVEQGTEIVENPNGDMSMSYEKLSNGTAKIWCRTAVVGVVDNNYVAGRAAIKYPAGITFVEQPCAFITINHGFNNQTDFLHVNAKIQARPSEADAIVHDPNGKLKEGEHIAVSLFIVGKWK